MPKKDSPDPDFNAIVEAGTHSERGSVLAPNTEGTGRKIQTLGGGVLEAEHVARIENGEYVVTVFGRIKYEDIFGCAHWTTFCFRYAKENSWYAYSDYYNEADDNRCP